MRDAAPDSDESDAASAAAVRLTEVGRFFYERGWAYATSGNYSVVLERHPLRMIITASGRPKGELGPADFLIVDDVGRAAAPASANAANGASIAPSGLTLATASSDPAPAIAPEKLSPAMPSAETLLHTTLAAKVGAGAVLHTHSVWNTLLSDHFARRGAVPLAGFEMLKGLAGVTTHETVAPIAVFENTQDIAALAKSLQRRLDNSDASLRHGFLIRGHGLYTWGRDLAEARRHVEALEFLFEVVGRQLSVKANEE